MRLAAALLTLLLGAAGSAIAQDPAETDVAAFQRLRAEGVAAARADDLVTAMARLTEADARIPNHPGLMLMRARLAATTGQRTEAVAQARRYADAGLFVNLEGDAILSGLAGELGFYDVAKTVLRNRRPVGGDRLTPLATVAGDGLVESVARDEPRSRWLVSMVRDRTIIALSDAGETLPFLNLDPGIGGVLGLALDPAKGLLWAATAPAAPAVHGLPQDFQRPVSALLKIDVASGAVLARYPAPTVDQALGDVLLGATGAVYVAGGDLFVLRPGGETLEVMTPAGLMRSPQGMAETPDGAGLIVADYSSGLWRVNLVTGAAVRLSAPENASLIGIDGLTTDGRFIYGLQNGVSPQRVLKLTLDAGWRRIDRVEVLAANLPQIDEPTTGLVRDGELVFVSRSQWSDFDGEGAPRTPSPEPALISRLRLD